MYFGIKHLQTKIQCDKSLTLKFIHEFSCPFYTGNFVILGDLALSMFFLAVGPSNFLAVTIWILGGRFHKIALSKQKSKRRVIIVPNLCLTHYILCSLANIRFSRVQSNCSPEKWRQPILPLALGDSVPLSMSYWWSATSKTPE